MNTETGSNTLTALSIALQAAGFGSIGILLSLLNLNVIGQSANFIFLPLAILFYWPRGSSYVSSLWTIFFLGLLHDLASGGPLGLWTLTLVILFIIIDPTVRHARYSFASQWIVFSLLILSGAFVSSVLSFMSLRVWPQFGTSLLNVGLVIAVFPGLHALHKLVSQTEQNGLRL